MHKGTFNTWIIYIQKVLNKYTDVSKHIKCVYIILWTSIISMGHKNVKVLIDVKGQYND